MKKAYLAGGCFWCIAKPYDSIKGVNKVISGYSGGNEENPTYEDVKKQKTGHRETILIEYDENTASYEEILDTFFYNVDPFDDGGQFIDRGHSYTLAIYYLDEDQKALALKKINELEEKSHQKVFVSVEPFKSFYRAEEYHQDFAARNPEKFEKELIESGRKKIS